MRKNNFYPFAFAALMLGACTSESDLTDGVKGPQWNANGKGYVNLAIQLPTQPNTRANDIFDDGKAEEYEVKDATLILFVGDKFNSAYDMKLNFSPEGTTIDNISTTAKITQEINQIEDKSEISALVVLNNNGLFAIRGTQLMINGQPFEGTLDLLNDELKNVDGSVNGVDDSWHDNGLLMSNAVLATAPGHQNPELSATLAPIAADKIFSTRGEADANPAAMIYVERAEAKVTLTAKDGETTNGAKQEYQILGWALDNTNETNKLVRSVKDFNTWKGYVAEDTSDPRFVGKISVSQTTLNNLYRVYWGDDYNYSVNGETVETGLKTVGGPHAGIASVNPADGTTPAYCFENTTTLAGMLEKNLTRVIVKAQFNDGKSFYTLDNDRSVIWDKEENVKKEVAARFLIDPTIANWANGVLNPGETLSSEDFVVTLSSEAQGRRTVTGITLSDSGIAKVNDNWKETWPVNAPNLANSHIIMDYYAGGVSYYPVYIKHFGDDLTPWNLADADPSNIYKGGEKNFLGRYGVLRNNWYDITVNSIKSLGAPNVEEVTKDPVDKKESYISVKINILSWAKRQQNVDL